jgi:PPIC-type PPIASE domain
MLTRLAIILVAVVSVAIGLAGCGGSGGEPIVARVGASAVTKSELTRLIAAMAPEHVAPAPPRYLACIKHQEALALAGSTTAELEEECERQYQTLKGQALSLLISAYWLIGEASAEGLKISAREVAAQERAASRTLIAGGAVAGDVELKARAELSALRIRKTLSERTPTPSPAEVAMYYRQHRQRFERRELRYVDLAENFENVGAARKVMAEFRSGARDISTDSLHEILERTDQEGAYGGAKKAALEALFAAKPHVLSGPILLNTAYSVFEVTRTVPPTRLSLASVRQSIAAQLIREQRQRALAQFVASMRARWTAKTDCATGYVVPRCRQYRGGGAPEEPLALE